MPQIRCVQKLTIKAFISLYSPYNTPNKHKTRTRHTPTRRINQHPPRTEVEVGTETVPVHARVAAGEERDRIWERQKRDYPQFEDYESKTSRVIPVVLLERI